MRSAKIQIPVRKPVNFPYLLLFVQGKRERFRRVEYLKFGNVNLNLSRGKV